MLLFIVPMLMFTCALYANQKSTTPRTPARTVINLLPSDHNPFQVKSFAVADFWIKKNPFFNKIQQQHTPYLLSSLLLVTKTPISHYYALEKQGILNAAPCLKSILNDIELYMDEGTPLLMITRTKKQYCILDHRTIQTYLSYIVYRKSNQPWNNCQHICSSCTNPITHAQAIQTLESTKEPITLCSQGHIHVTKCATCKRVDAISNGRNAHNKTIAMECTNKTVPILYAARVFEEHKQNLEQWFDTLLEQLNTVQERYSQQDKHLTSGISLVRNKHHEQYATLLVEIQTTNERINGIIQQIKTRSIDMRALFTSGSILYALQHKLSPPKNIAKEVKKHLSSFFSEHAKRPINQVSLATTADKASLLQQYKSNIELLRSALDETIKLITSMVDDYKNARL